MQHEFDAGYPSPFDDLVGDYPGTDVYPEKDFRTEWGPVFHRGRLDGSARVLVIGQDPAQHEAIARRILVGEAGQRVQGFLAKAGVDRSYVMINAFLYSVYGQGAGERHRANGAIAAYRNRWLDAIVERSPIEVVVTFGTLAAEAHEQWTDVGGAGADVPCVVARHPTSPESAAAHGEGTYASAMRKLLDNWNDALRDVRDAVSRPDASRPLEPYGKTLRKGDLRPVPEGDVPPGLPAWMRGADEWAKRTGRSAALKRATITVTVPVEHRPG